MYISFNLNDQFYSGTATLLKNKQEVQCVVDLNDSNPEPIQFVLQLQPDKKEWACSDEIDPKLISAAIAEIDREDIWVTKEPMIPNSYPSDAKDTVEPD